MLYLPFLRRYERLADDHARVQYEALLASFQDDERAGRSVELVAAAGSLGAVARSLAEDVRAAVGAGAVSYTHLDVYKRQAPPRPSRWGTA